MADRWWTNGGGDNDWNNAANWSATEGGAGGAGVPTSADRALFSATSSSANCTLSADAECLNLYLASANTGGTDNYNGALNAATYNVHVYGDCRLTGNAATVAMGSGTWTVDGHFYWAVASWSQGTSTLVMTTDGKNIGPQATRRELYDVQINGNTGMTYLCNMHLLSVASGKTFSCGYLVSVARLGTITGATINAPLEINSTAGINALPTDGTLAKDVTIVDLNGVFPTVPCRAFGASLTIRLDARDNNTMYLGSADGQTLEVAGNLIIDAYLGAAGRAMTFDFSGHSPDVVVGGSFYASNLGGTTTNLLMGNGEWRVGGTCDLRRLTVTAGNSELVLDGSTTQTVYGDAQELNDLTLENDASFADSFQIGGTLTAGPGITATFLSGGVYAIGDLNLNGGAAETPVTLVASGATAYQWNVTASPQTAVNYVDVANCDASLGSEIDASDGTNVDSGGTVNWDFGGAIRIIYPWHTPGFNAGFGRL